MDEGSPSGACPARNSYFMYGTCFVHVHDASPAVLNRTRFYKDPCTLLEIGKTPEFFPAVCGFLMIV